MDVVEVEVVWGMMSGVSGSGRGSGVLLCASAGGCKGRVGMGVDGTLEVVEREAAYAAAAAATMAASCLCFALLSCTSDLSFKNLRKS